jgi:hypothetical protein
MVILLGGIIPVFASLSDSRRRSGTLNGQLGTYWSLGSIFVFDKFASYDRSETKRGDKMEADFCGNRFPTKECIHNKGRDRRKGNHSFS